MKKFVLVTLKIGLSIAIIVWLVVRACDVDTFGDLRDQFNNHGFSWPAILGAFAAFFVSVLLTLIRWCYLVRALGMEISMRDAIRIGFLGYLFNLAPMGIVGGDLLKAVMLARQQPQRRAQAVATVAVDRIIGLYILFIVASVAIVLTGFWHHPQADIRYISLGALAITVLATIGLGILSIPSLTGGRLSGKLRQTSTLGRQAASLIEAVRLYRDNGSVLLLSCALTVGVHCLFSIGIYLATMGIYRGNVAALTLSGEFVVAPLSAATSVIPLMMGPMEVVLNFLYANVFALAKSQGLVVALGYRLMTLLIATVGMCYYLSARSEVSTLMHEVEEGAAEDVGFPDAMSDADKCPALSSGSVMRQ